MEIELRRIAYNPRLDENAFAANLFINDVKAATVTNKGNGTQYYPIDTETSELVGQAENFLAKQPGEKKVVDGKEQTVKQTLSDRIDALFAAHLMDIERKKFDKKVNLLAKRNIVIGEPGRYMRSHAMKAPVDVLAQGSGKALIIEAIEKKVIPSMSEKEQILNTNIPVEIFKEAGLSEGQYLKLEAEQEANKSVKKNQGIKP